MVVSYHVTAPLERGQSGAVVTTGDKFWSFDVPSSPLPPHRA